MSDLVLAPCMTCFGWAEDRQVQSGFWSLKRSEFDRTVIEQHDHCPDCEGAGWLLVEGEPIDLEDLERMAPWADEPKGRPLESGELNWC